MTTHNLVYDVGQTKESKEEEIISNIEAGIFFVLAFLVILQARLLYQLGVVRTELELMRHQVESMEEKMESQVRYFLKKLWDGQYPRM